MYQLRTLGTLDLRAVDGPPVNSLLALPKRTAVLCYLAVANPHGFHRRDRIAAVFWPESDTERARHSLRQALHGIRNSLGENALLVRGDDEISVNPATVWCDAPELDRAFEERRWADVLTLYAGRLLDAFYVRECPEFELWLEQERERLHGLAKAAAWNCADAAAESGAADAALSWGRRALELAGVDESALRRYLQLAASVGEHGAGLKAYDRFVRCMRRDYDLEPSADTESLVRGLRQATTLPPDPPVVPCAPTATDPAAPVALPGGAPGAVGGTVVTWRRARLAAVAGLALLAVWLLGLRITHAGPPESGSLVLAEIRPAGVEPQLAASVTELLRSGLMQSSELRPLTPQEMNDALARMRRIGAPLDDTTALTLARREGLKATLGGELRRVGREYVLFLRLTSAADGSALLDARQAALDTSRIVAAVRRLGPRLRAGIGERLERLPPPEPLARVTTGSLAALRQYTAAMRAITEGRDPLDNLNAALAADSGFSMAWREWARRNAEDDYLSPRVIEAIDRAYRTREGLPEVERLSIEAEHYWMHYRPAQAADRWRAVLALDSTSSTARLGLGWALLSQRQFAAAESALARVLSKHPRHLLALTHLVDARVGQGRLASADSLIARYRPPQDAWVISKLLSAKRDYRALLAHLDSLPEPKHPASIGVAFWGTLMLGRLREADELLTGSPNVFRLRARLRYGTRDTAAVARAFDEYAARLRLDTLPYYVPDLVPLLTEIGRVPEARRMLERWRGTMPADARLLEHRARDEGAIALAEGRLMDAVRRYLQWHADPMVAGDHAYNRGLPEAAAILERLGKADTAITLYERAVRERSWHMYPMVWESLWYPFTLRHMGELYEKRADTAKAVDYYSRFIDLWQDADPELQGQVTTARAARDGLLRTARRCVRC